MGLTHLSCLYLVFTQYRKVLENRNCIVEKTLPRPIPSRYVHKNWEPKVAHRTQWTKAPLICKAVLFTTKWRLRTSAEPRWDMSEKVRYKRNREWKFSRSCIVFIRAYPVFFPFPCCLAAAKIIDAGKLYIYIPHSSNIYYVINHDTTIGIK